MRKIIMPILAIFLAAGILLGLYNGLLGVREENRAEELQKKMETLVPGSSSFVPEPYTGEDTTIESVYKGETGYVIATQTNGYAGPIAMLIGVSNEGTVTGLQVRNMSETYGLGAEALSDWEFLAQFLHTKGDAQVGENVDALTGATVTSKAIARSVNAAAAVVTGADTSSSATSWGG